MNRKACINSSKFTTDQKEAILALLDQIGGDGHSVYKPSILASFPQAIQDRFTHEIKIRRELLEKHAP